MGAVLAYAATGEYPFGTGPADARTLRVLFMAPDLDKVPAGLRPLLERCLAKEPAERPTAGDFLADLAAACPEAVGDRYDWLPEDILAETRQRPLPEKTAASGLRVAAPPSAAAPAPGGVSPLSQGTRPRTWKNWRIQAAVAAVIVAVLGTVTALLAAPSGNPAAAGVGFNWTGITNFKETISSDNGFKPVGSTWSDEWSFRPDCGPQSCYVILTGNIGDVFFAAILSRHGLTYSGNAAINNYWSCPSDNTTADSKIYITLTGQSTAGPNGPDISSFTGVLNWRVDPEDKCSASAEYDMQVQSGVSV